MKLFSKKDWALFWLCHFGSVYWTLTQILSLDPVHFWVTRIQFNVLLIFVENFNKIAFFLVTIPWLCRCASPLQTTIFICWFSDLWGLEIHQQLGEIAFIVKIYARPRHRRHGGSCTHIQIGSTTPVGSAITAWIKLRCDSNHVTHILSMIYEGPCGVPSLICQCSWSHLCPLLWAYHRENISICPFSTLPLQPILSWRTTGSLRLNDIHFRASPI